MIQRIEEQKLSDGSIAYNLLITESRFHAGMIDDPPPKTVRFICVDEKSAYNLMYALEDLHVLEIEVL